MKLQKYVSFCVWSVNNIKFNEVLVMMNGTVKWFNSDKGFVSLLLLTAAKMYLYIFPLS